MTDPDRDGERTVLVAGTVVALGTAAPGWVAVEGERIAAVGHGAPPPGGTRRDLGAGAVIVPGFVDQHVHGGAGAAFTGGDPAEALRAVQFHRAHGTTTTLASLVAASPAELRRDVAALTELVADGELAGVHLEGPWLATARCGAHDPRQLRDPDPAELAALLATGVVRMVTLAPERAGGLEAVRRIVDAGAIAAVGHTDASYALTREAIAAGARVGTHLFNAMAPVHHREPGPAIALLEDPRVVVELVTDGLHVHPALWRHVLAAAGPDRIAAVTDAMAAAGMPDGDYRLGALRVTVTDRVARVAGPDGASGPIAGSTATTADLFARLVAEARLPRAEALAQAVALTATTPARVLGLADEVGALASGLRADVVVLDEGADGWLRVREVLRAGRIVEEVLPRA
ncbi:N-acetylglucosamine-6-phosphate deacetylase [Pseudonocardia thermophila]|uniref:N-acetylglucosamine-6-phosphate deacetylase n=1 Tax=Pseudonocardia thermophila TaxID=1848 RepID=UPI00248D3ECA|nr:amidohydrolase family protein [Pseudonocardia thermophila]